MNRFVSLLSLGIGLAAGLSITTAAAAERVDIKLATILPEGTSAHNRLMELRDTWHKTSAQTVRLTVFNGAADGEVQLVKKMRAGQVQAALMSIVGLSQIDRSVTCLQLMPLQFRDWREVDYVREKIRGELEARMREKGFEVLFWGDAGWVRFFTKEPAVGPADLRPMKMFVWSGEPNQPAILRTLGYQPVTLETEQIMPQLSTGMITVVPLPPFMANAMQSIRYANHMIDLNWVPIVGAAVVRRDAWEKIPLERRGQLRSAAEALGEKIRAGARAEDDDAIVAMKKRGLVVHTPSPADVVAWRALAARSYPLIRGKMVPEELFDRVQTHVAEFRAAAGTANP
jgi:TRAP-type transport system periplasmic protein